MVANQLDKRLLDAETLSWELGIIWNLLSSEEGLLFYFGTLS